MVTNFTHPNHVCPSYKTGEAVSFIISLCAKTMSLLKYCKRYVDHLRNIMQHNILNTNNYSLAQVTRGKLRPTGSHQVQFFSFCQDKDSVLNSNEGRKKLKAVGIESPLQVGEWLVKVFREDFQQEELADQLEVFMNKNTK